MDLTNVQSLHGIIDIGKTLVQVARDLRALDYDEPDVGQSRIDVGMYCLTESLDISAIRPFLYATVNAGQNTDTHPMN